MLIKPHFPWGNCQGAVTSMARLWAIIILIFMGCSPKASLPPPITPTPIIPALTLLTPNIQIEPIYHTPIRNMNSLHQNIQDYTVAFVKADKSGDIFPYCTGIWISPYEILTAGHCIYDKDKDKDKSPIDRIIQYTIAKDVPTDTTNFNDITKYPGIVISFNKNNDLAIIQTYQGTPTHLITQLANELPAIGETVYGVGNPDGLFWIYIQGEISSYHMTESLGMVTQANISVYFGDSGGGLFDSKGNLIGICSKLLEITNSSYYVHLDTIKSFLWKAHHK